MPGLRSRRSGVTTPLSAGSLDPPSPAHSSAPSDPVEVEPRAPSPSPRPCRSPDTRGRPALVFATLGPTCRYVNAGHRPTSRCPALARRGGDVPSSHADHDCGRGPGPALTADGLESGLAALRRFAAASGGRSPPRAGAGHSTSRAVRRARRADVAIPPQVASCVVSGAIRARSRRQPPRTG